MGAKVVAGEVVWLINGTVDGRCGHADVIADDDLHRHATESLDGVDAVLFGRRTFELLEPHWSAVARDRSGTDAENEFAAAIDRARKVVFSRTVGAVGWNGRVVSTDPAKHVRGLRRDGARLLVQASPGLAGELRRAGLVDRWRLLLQPIVAGTGPTLFREDESSAIRLDEARAFPSGAVALDYTFVRAASD